jgi:hypothetical protein
MRGDFTVFLVIGLAIAVLVAWYSSSIASGEKAAKLKWSADLTKSRIEFSELRDALLRKARQLETASQINQWLSSPELKPPE